MSTNVLARTGDDRRAILLPDGFGRGPRTVRAISGVWRTRLGRLAVLESGGTVVAKDPRRSMVGAVMRTADGRSVTKGVFRGSDGVAGTFEWIVEAHGERMSGVLRTAGGGQWPLDATKESGGVPRDLVGDMMGGGPGLGALDGVKYCDWVVMGVKVGRVPCGWSGKGPGNTDIKVDREGVKIGTEESMEQGSTPAPEGESAEQRSKRYMKVALWVAGIAAVIGIVAMRRGKSSGQVQA